MPDYLYIQLLRYDYHGPKIMTFVKIESELQLPIVGENKYEPVGFLNHIGESRDRGHYITYLKQNSNHWIRFDDTNVCYATFEEANTEDNYILLFTKKNL